MRIENWNDLRVLLAVQRGRTLAAAARCLGVDGTTVGRRLAVLEAQSATPLVQRQGDGTLGLTEAGVSVAREAEAMEQHVLRIAGGAAAMRDASAGTVRLTAVPMLANRLLAPALAPLLDRYPHLQIELVPDSRNFNLTRRETDLALRLARPASGGSRIKARRLATLGFGAFAPRRRRPDRLRWIGYDEAMAHLPQARWIAAATRGQPETLTQLRVHDAETAWAAAAAGLGKTLLPRTLAADDRRLVEIAVEGPALPAREVWLLGDADQMRLARIATVVGWIESTVRAAV